MEARKEAEPKAPKSGRRPAPGFARLQRDALVDCYLRLRDKGASHLAALTALGEFIVLYVLLADKYDGSIEAGGKNPYDTQGYRHKLLAPGSFKDKNGPRFWLKKARLIDVDGDGVLAAINRSVFDALTDTARIGPDGIRTSRAFVAINRRELRRLADELRQPGVKARGRVLASIALLTAWSNEAGNVDVGVVARRLRVDPRTVAAMIDLLTRHGYAEIDPPPNSRARSPLVNVAAIRDRLAQLVDGPTTAAVVSEGSASGNTPPPSEEVPTPDRALDAREPFTSHLVGTGRRTTPAVGTRGAKLDGWVPGPATKPAYRDWTAQAVGALAYNLPAVRELLDAYDGRRLGEGLRRAVTEAVRRVEEILEGFEADGELPDAADRDLVDIVARAARWCDDICRVEHQHHVASVFATEDPTADSGSTDVSGGGRRDSFAAVTLLMARLRPFQQQARKDPRWRSTSGNWRGRETRSDDGIIALAADVATSLAIQRDRRSPRS